MDMLKMCCGREYVVDDRVAAAQRFRRMVNVERIWEFNYLDNST